ncbi:RseA family anti-sigma factor [Gilliamella sp. Pas-s25]|uniref:RseA family anti-sigma factor n=1 Tax=Gilliamella sp. Pas-s25 TaxID=2687310 RepID=UPI0013654EA3|nr:RseA family anti-sigma factor [Gilliamella sp. Pas-s25]
MQIERKEQLSLLMDGEFTNDHIVDEMSHDESLQSYWHRYHIVRDTMRGQLHSSSLTLDISNQIAQAIATEDLYNQLADQPNINTATLPKAENLIWIHVKDFFAKASQVGLAACVTLGIIAGVQYHQGQTDNTSISPTLNTVPVGVNVAPVGGIHQQNDQQLLEKRQYDKIRLLVQDYELQKRLNAR